MTTVKIPLDQPVYTNVRHEELNDANARLIDGYQSESGATISRPPLKKVLDLETDAPIDGLFWWTHKKCAIAVCAGRIYRIDLNSDFENNLVRFIPEILAATDITGEVLPANRHCTFTTDGTRVFIACESAIVYTDGFATTQFINSTYVPSQVTHIRSVDSYLLANQKGTNKFFWSDVANYSNWAALNFAQAAGNADPIEAIEIFNREVYLIGSDTLEVWENDGSTPFSRVPGGFVEVGCIAPHSPVKTDNHIYFLNHNKRIVRLRGTGVEPVATPYDREIQQLSSPQACLGQRLETFGQPLLIFDFPADQKTYAYNYEKERWSEWGAWNAAAGQYEGWRARHLAFCKDWNITLAGSREDSILYVIDDSDEDRRDDSSPIRVSRRTGHIDYGTPNNKRSERITLKLKRGQGLGSHLEMQGAYADEVLTNATLLESAYFNPQNGIKNATALREDSSNGVHTLAYTRDTIAGEQYQEEFWMRSTERAVLFYIASGISCGFSLYQGAMYTWGASIKGADMIPGGDGWFLCRVIWEETSDQTRTITLYMVNQSGFTSYEGNGTSEIYLYGHPTDTLEVVTPEPKMFIRWRDNKGAWGNPVPISLGKQGDNEIIQQLHRTGIFRTRQYEVFCSDPVELVLGECFEDITVLSR